MIITTGLRRVEDRYRKEGHPVIFRYYDEYGEMKARTCTICGEVKYTSEFYRRCSTADGYASRCSECR